MENTLDIIPRSASTQKQRTEKHRRASNVSQIANKLDKIHHVSQVYSYITNVTMIAINRNGYEFGYSLNSVSITINRNKYKFSYSLNRGLTLKYDTHYSSNHYACYLLTPCLTLI